MPGNEPVKIIVLQAEVVEIVPAAHVLARSRQARHLAKHLQHAIVIEVQESRMVLFELLLHGPVVQLDIVVWKDAERSGDCDQLFLRISPRPGGPR